MGGCRTRGMQGKKKQGARDLTGPHNSNQKTCVQNPKMYCGKRKRRNQNL